MEFEAMLMKNQADVHPLFIVAKGKRMAGLNLSKSNERLHADVYQNTETLEAFIEAEKKLLQADFLVGGYREHREMYRRSPLFDTNLEKFNDGGDQPRSIHLGIDIWGPAGTAVYAPLGGMVHSFAYNAQYGDYGATIILQHQLETMNFYTLYGHLALQDIAGLDVGRFITRGQRFAHFGKAEENGNWPPHLHFQIIKDMLQFEGDFPGVCKPAEVAKYFAICPDPDLLLGLNRQLRH